MNIEKGLKIVGNVCYTVMETVAAIIGAGIVCDKVPDGKLQDFLIPTVFYGTITAGEALRSKTMEKLNDIFELEDSHITVDEEIGS